MSPSPTAAASVLVQVGLIDREALPVSGGESAKKLLDPASVPFNTLIGQAR